MSKLLPEGYHLQKRGKGSLGGWRNYVSRSRSLGSSSGIIKEELLTRFHIDIGFVVFVQYIWCLLLFW